MRSMESNLSITHLQKTLAYFNEASLSRLLKELRQKYIRQGSVSGTITLNDATWAERSFIAELLGKPLPRSSSCRISLRDFDAALQRSGFHCTLVELLSAFFSEQPLQTQKEQRIEQAERQAAFYQCLQNLAQSLPENSTAQRWLLEGNHGIDWLFTHQKRLVSQKRITQELFFQNVCMVASGLNQLPSPGQYERLAIFAQRISGDPHFLDADHETGKLFLYALTDLTMLGEGRDENLHLGESVFQGRAAVLHLYRAVGLLYDGISSFVTIARLLHAQQQNGTSDPLIEAAAGRILQLPLRQLAEWVYCSASSKDIYLIENPPVFEEVEAYLVSYSQIPTLVCTSGWPGVAVYTLLEQLLRSDPDLRLHYSGDFDKNGLQIAAAILKRYPQHCHLWRFDPQAYLTALQFGGLSAPPADLASLEKLPSIFYPLVKVMQQEKKWAYQEGIAKLLVADIIEKHQSPGA